MKDSKLIYFRRSVTNLSRSFIITFIVPFLEYFCFSANMFISNYYIKNNNMSINDKKYISIYISVVHQFHGLFQNYIIPLYIPIIFCVIVLAMNITIYLKYELPNYLESILINFFEIFVVRFLSLFILDSIINQVVYYSFVIDKTINLVSFTVFTVVLIFVAASFLFHITTYYTMSTVTINYIFNHITKQFETILLFLKIFISFNINLLERDSNREEIKNLLLFLNLFIFTIIVCYSFYFLRVCYLSSVYLINNHPIRLKIYFVLNISLESIFFLVFQSTSSFEFVLLSVSLTILCAYIAYSYNPIKLTFYYWDYKDLKAQMTLLIYLIGHVEKEKENAKLLIKNFKHHTAFCNNDCFLCLQIQNKKLAHNDDTETIEKVLEIYHHIYYLEIQKQYQLHKFSSFFYDLFFLLQLLKNQKTFNFHNHYLCKKIISRYYNTEKGTKTINLSLAVQNYLEIKNLKENSKYKVLVSSYELTNQMIGVIQDIRMKIQGKIKSPKDFIYLSDKLRTIKSEEIKKFLGQRENMNYYPVVMLRLVYEDILQKPVRKEEGLLRKEKTYSEEFLEYHFLSDHVMIVEVFLVQNTFIIRRTGNHLIKYLNMDLRNLFPDKFQKNGIDKIKELINSGDTVKQFTFIIIIPSLKSRLKDKVIYGDAELNDSELEADKSSSCSKNKDVEYEYYLFTFSFSVCPGIDKSDLTLLGEYNIFQEGVLLTLTNDYQIKKSSGHAFFESSMVINASIAEQECVFSASSKVFELDIFPKELIQDCIRNKDHHKETLFGERKRKKKPSITKRRNDFFFRKKDLGLLTNYFRGKDKEGNLQIKKNLENYSLIFHFSIHIDRKLYKVYLLIKTTNVAKHKGTLKAGTDMVMKKIEEKNMNMIKTDINFMDGTSSLNTPSTMSIQSSIAYHRKDDSDTNHISTKRLTEYQAKFSKFKLIIFLFCIFIMVVNVIQLLIDVILNENVKKINSIYNITRDANRLYYVTLSSFFSVICVGLPNSSECITSFREYGLQLQKDADLSSNPFEYLITENRLKVDMLTNYINSLKAGVYSLNNKELSDLFDIQLTYKTFSIIKEEIKVHSQNVTFSNALQILINSLITIVQEPRYTELPIYIISVEQNDLSNIFDIENVKDWQVKYYSSLMNYQTFLITWRHIQTNLYQKVKQKLNLYKIVSYMFLVLIFFLHCILFFLLALYLYTFLKLVILDINQIINKTKSKTISKFLITKYNVLFKMCQLYEINPVSLINHITKMIKKQQEEFHKTKAQKTMTLERQYSSTTSKDSDGKSYLYGEKKKKKRKQYVFSLYYEIIKYLIYIIIAAVIYYALIFFIFLILWNKEMTNISIIFEQVELISSAESSGFNDFTLMQTMFLGNVTESEMSKSLGSDSPTYISDDMISAINIIYKYEKINKKNNGLIPSLSNYINPSCNSFYSNINDVLLIEADKQEPEKKHLENIEKICNYLNFFEFQAEANFYSKLFYEMYQVIKEIKHYDYLTALSFLKESKLIDIMSYQYFLIRPLRTWYNGFIYSTTINQSTTTETRILIAYMIVGNVSEIVLYILLYFFFFQKIKLLNENMNLLTIAFRSH